MKSVCATTATERTKDNLRETRPVNTTFRAHPIRVTALRAAALLYCLILTAGAATAADRTVLGELFTATW